jgi:hypothetical protein
LPTLGKGTPAIGICFDLFISKHGLKGPTSMIEVEDILDQESLGVKSGNE